MKDDFTLFEKLKETGATPEIAVLKARGSGLDSFTQIRMLRGVFNLSVVEAKEIFTVAGTKIKNLNEHQEELLKPLQEAFCQKSATMPGLPNVSASSESPPSSR